MFNSVGLKTTSPQVYFSQLRSNILPCSSNCLYKGVPGKGVRIEKFANSILFRSIKSTVFSKTPLLSESKPKMKAPIIPIPLS